MRSGCVDLERERIGRVQAAERDRSRHLGEERLAHARQPPCVRAAARAVSSRDFVRRLHNPTRRRSATGGERHPGAAGATAGPATVSAPPSTSASTSAPSPDVRRGGPCDGAGEPSATRDGVSPIGRQGDGEREPERAPLARSLLGVRPRPRAADPAAGSAASRSPAAIAARICVLRTGRPSISNGRHDDHVPAARSRRAPPSDAGVPGALVAERGVGRHQEPGERRRAPRAGRRTRRTASRAAPGRSARRPWSRRRPRRAAARRSSGSHRSGGADPVRTSSGWWSNVIDHRVRAAARPPRATRCSSR